MTPALQAALLGRGSWTPARLGTDKLPAWWDAGYGVTQSSGAVSSWLDRQARYNLSQATGSLQPLWAPTGFLGLREGVTFDGVDDFLDVVGVPTTFPTGASEGWIFCLCNFVGVSTIGGYGSTAAAGARLLTAATVTLLRLRVQDGATSLTDTAHNISGAHLAEGHWLGSSEEGYQDGDPTNPASAVTTSSTGTTRVRIGGTLNTTPTVPTNGTVAHFMVGTGLLTVDDRQKLEGWALWSVGLQANLPANHPYRNRRP